jgi:hypothetical protein
MGEWRESLRKEVCLVTGIREVNDLAQIEREHSEKMRFEMPIK